MLKVLFFLLVGVFFLFWRRRKGRMLRCIGRRRLRSVVDGGRRSLCEAVGENDLTSMVGGAVPLAMDLLPEGVASPIARHFSLLGRSSLLVRDVDVKLNDEIDRAVVDGRVVGWKTRESLMRRDEALREDRKLFIRCFRRSCF